MVGARGFEPPASWSRTVNRRIFKHGGSISQSARTRKDVMPWCSNSKRKRVGGRYETYFARLELKPALVHEEGIMRRRLAIAGVSLLADDDNGKGSLSKGDAAPLRFAAAAEILESDFWIQYNELGGIQDKEVPGGTGIPAYTTALQVLDSDFSQYILDKRMTKSHTLLSLMHIWFRRVPLQLIWRLSHAPRQHCDRSECGPNR